MRINVLQHTPNEGPGAIAEWADRNNHEMYIYHPYQFGNLPTVDQTDFLVILGGPMSPNDDLPWIKREQDLLKQVLDQHKPVLGICYGAQEIAKVLGYRITKAPHKEVGWAPVYRQTDQLPDIPEQLNVLHWHEEMFEIPDQAQLLFSSDLVKNQGFILGDNVIGLQFHLEPLPTNVREIATNDDQYPLDHNDLHQTAGQIISHGLPKDNRQILFNLLSDLTRH